MKVCVVIPSFYPATIYGGTIFASLNLARLMSELEHEVNVSTTNTNKKDRLNVITDKHVELEKNLFVRYYNETIVDKLSLPLLFGLKKDIQQADLIHIQAIFNTPTPVALFLSYILKKPVLLSPHGVLGDWIMNQGFGLKKIWLSFFIRPFSRYVHWHATSEQEKREILSHFPHATIHILPNPIDLKIYSSGSDIDKTTFLKKFGNKDGMPEKIILSMGRLQRKKGFDILIKAFEKVRESFPGSYLFIAGEDEGEKINLIQLIKRKKLEECIFLTGNLQDEEKIVFLRNADVFVLPSHNENFGIVYAEALAAGTPIVASKDTPWEEVEKYGCGRWVTNTIEETANATIDLLQRSNEETRKRAKTYAEKFSSENIRMQLAKLITEVTKANA